MCHMLHYMYAHIHTHTYPRAIIYFPAPAISTRTKVLAVYTDHHHWWRPLDWGRNVWSIDKIQLSNSSPASVVPKILPCWYQATHISSNVLSIIITWSACLCVCVSVCLTTLKWSAVVTDISWLSLYGCIATDSPDFLGHVPISTTLWCYIGSPEMVFWSKFLDRGTNFSACDIIGCVKRAKCAILPSMQF